MKFCVSFESIFLILDTQFVLLQLDVASHAQKRTAQSADMITKHIRASALCVVKHAGEKKQSLKLMMENAKLVREYSVPFVLLSNWRNTSFIQKD